MLACHSVPGRRRTRRVCWSRASAIAWADSERTRDAASSTASGNPSVARAMQRPWPGRPAYPDLQHGPRTSAPRRLRRAGARRAPSRRRSAPRRAHEARVELGERLDRARHPIRRRRAPAGSVPPRPAPPTPHATSSRPKWASAQPQDAREELQDLHRRPAGGDLHPPDRDTGVGRPPPDLLREPALADARGSTRHTRPGSCRSTASTRSRRPTSDVRAGPTLVRRAVGREPPGTQRYPTWYTVTRCTGRSGSDSTFWTAAGTPSDRRPRERNPRGSSDSRETTRPAEATSSSSSHASVDVSKAGPPGAEDDPPHEVDLAVAEGDRRFRASAATNRLLAAQRRGRAGERLVVLEPGIARRGRRVVDRHVVGGVSVAPTPKSAS